MLFQVKREHKIIDIDIDQILESKLTLDLHMIISFRNSLPALHLANK